ncbi:radical SAM protein [Candidatus Bathyarchaeota archaeon]|nr:radical SAM protein [Candidatus Bathyarchaeota archaeon]
MVTDLKKATSLMIRSLTPNRPYHVQWLITRKCNYRCRGCNVWREQDSRELSTEEIKQGLDVLRELGVVEVVLSGGNPLLREDAGEIIRYASQFFITTVYDNGSMATEKIDALRHADFVAISIDSLDPEKNDYIRGVKGAWRKTISAVEKLHNEGIAVSVSPTISQFNLHEILDFTNYFTQREIPIWYCLYSYDTCEQTQLFAIGKRVDEFAIADTEKMVEVCNSLIKLKKKNSKILMTTKILRAIRDLYRNGKRNWQCRALRNFFVIDHLGRVAACHLHNPITSIHNLPKLWNSNEFDELRRKYSQCTQCTYMCYIFYSLHGSILGNVQIAQEQWKNAKLLFKKEKTRFPSSAKPQLSAKPC